MMPGLDPVLGKLDAHGKGHGGEDGEKGTAEEQKDTGFFSKELLDALISHTSTEKIAREHYKGGSHAGQQGQDGVDAEPALFQVTRKKEIEIEIDGQELAKNVEGIFDGKGRVEKIVCRRYRVAHRYDPGQIIVNAPEGDVVQLIPDKPVAGIVAGRHTTKVTCF